MKSITNTLAICTRNRKSEILRLFPSIQAQIEMPDEIIIVDSSDIPLQDDPEFLNTFDQLKIKKKVLYHTKPGLTYQRNVGIKKATQDIIHFIDDDTVLMSDYIKEMNKIFKECELYHGGMGTVINHNAKRFTLFRLLRIFFCLQREQASGDFTLSGQPTHAYGKTLFKKVESLGGCCMSFRRDTIKEYLFDEKLNGYCYMEDADISRRLSYTYPLFYNPKARMYHYPNEKNGEQRAMAGQMYIKNMQYLFYKNVYLRSRWRILFLWWSVCGLFIIACIFGDRDLQKGYIKGLKGSIR